MMHDQSPGFDGQSNNHSHGGGYTETPTDSNIDFQELVKKRYPLILLFAVIGLGISVFHFYSTIPMYRSSMDLLIGQRSTGLVAGSGSGSNSDVAGDGVIARSDILATHLKILNSPMLLSEIHKTISSDRYPALATAHLSSDAFVARARSNLSFDRPDPTASVVTVAYADVNPAFAKELLEVLYQGYRNYVDTHTESTGTKAITLLTKTLKENEEELRAATAAYQNYIEASPYLLEGESLSDMQHDRLRESLQELAATRSTISELKSRLSIIEERIGNGGTDLTDVDRLVLIGGNEQRLEMFLNLFDGGGSESGDMTTEAVRSKYQELVENNLRLEALRNDYGPDHPLIQSLQQEIAITENFIRENSPGDLEAGSLKLLTPEELLTSYLSLLKNDLTLATAREEELLKESEALRVSTKSVEGGYFRAAEMRSRIERAQSRYEEISLRLHEINITSSIMGFSSDILSPPTEASTPFSPNLVKVLGTGSALGLLCGLGLAYLRESTDQTFKNPEDLESTLRVPVIAHVSKFTINRSDRREALESGVASHIRTFHKPQSIDAEAFRLLRTMILLKDKERSVQTIGISSAHPSDGKSTVLANLAVSMAQLNKRVLLIDGDMRRPTVQSSFGISGDLGLSDCLMGDSDPADVSYDSPQANLSIMPNGTKVPNCAELLQSIRMEWLLENLKDQYDLIFVDLPPILAVTDPLVVAPLLDGLLIAARIKKNGRRPVEAAVKRAQSTNANLLGLVVNGSEKKTTGYGYSKYAESYRYGYVKEYQKQYQLDG